MSVIGEDFAQAELDAMTSAGMHLDGIDCPKGGKSFFWAGSYHDDMNGRDTLATELNVLADFKPVIPAAWRKAKWLMLGNIDPALQMSVLDQMEARPELVVLDTMNFWMDIAMEPLKAVIARVDVLTINDEEARQLSGERSFVRAAKVILAMGPCYLIIKKGEHGALLFHENGTGSSSRSSARRFPWRRWWTPPARGTRLPEDSSAMWPVVAPPISRPSRRRLWWAVRWRASRVNPSERRASEP